MAQNGTPLPGDMRMRSGKPHDPFGHDLRDARERGTRRGRNALGR